MSIGPVAANRRRTSTPIATIVTAPALSGRAIVGQFLFAAAGSYSIAPTSVVTHWEYEDATVLNDAGDVHLCDTIEAGDAFNAARRARFVEVATFSDGSTLTNPSALSAAIAARTLGGVNLVRTSALAAAPLVYTVTLPGDCYPGDVLRVQVATDTTFGTLNQQVAHSLQADEIADPTLIPAALVVEGLTDPGATDVMKVFIEARLPDDSVISNASGTIGKNYSPVVATDNFDDGTINPLLWGAPTSFTPEATGGTLAEVNGELEIVPPDGAAGHIALVSLNAASFVNKKVRIQRLTTNKSAGDEFYIRVGPDANNGYGIRIAGGTFTLRGYNAGATDAVDTSVADPDYGTGGAAPTTYGWVEFWNDYAAGVRDDIVIRTAPPTATKPPASGEFTERLRIARSDLYLTHAAAANCHVAIGGGQWPGYPAEFINTVKWDNFDTDMAL